MKDQLISITRTVAKNNKLNIAREYLQNYLLLLLQKYEFFRKAAFVGGTCLRIVYNVPRFSEDLDFSLLVNPTEFNFIHLIKYLRYELEAAGYALEITYTDNSNVVNAMIKFAGIMHDCGITSDPKQKLFIKLDIDTKPPTAENTSTSLVTRYFPLTLVHYDLASLLAGKINALLTRKYSKGRDYFDIFWILSQNKKISPNLNFLNNALAQFNYANPITEKNWRTLLAGAIAAADMSKITKDVVPFIENPHHLASFNSEGFSLLFEENHK